MTKLHELFEGLRTELSGDQLEVNKHQENCPRYQAIAKDEEEQPPCPDLDHLLNRTNALKEIKDFEDRLEVYKKLFEGFRQLEVTLFDRHQDLLCRYSFEMSDKEVCSPEMEARITQSNTVWKQIKCINKEFD